MESPAIVSAEDAVEVLIRHFVSPLLPRRCTARPPPTADQQKEVGKQMQAVVILYNFYQRKLSSKSKFLDFRSFCDTACISFPSLADYMKFMRNDARSSDHLHDQLSITEKLVMDACDICTALSTLVVSCTIDDWPISKVAVFLVDAAYEKCLLKNDSIILGSWSLVEKDLEKPLEKLCNAYDVEGVLQKTAYSSVEQDMGITCSNLNTLEYHLSYSLSGLKTNTLLFIMSYKVPVSSVKEIPIEDLISLQDLPVKGSSYGMKPEITAVAEHYCLLPYIDIIAKWASSRKKSRGDSPHLPWKKTIANSSDLPLITWNPQVSGQPKSNMATTDDGSLYSLHQSVDMEHEREISGKKKIKVECETSGPSQSAFQCKTTSLSLLDHNDNPCHDNSGSKGSISKKLSQTSKSIQSQGASHLILDGLKNQVECSVEKQCLARSDKNILEGVHADFTDQAKVEDSALQLIPAYPIVTDCAKRFLTLASNKYELEIFVLEFLKNRRDELCCQQRLLEDLIAHCEMNIQTMICAENQTSQSEATMKACDFLRSSNRGPHSVEVKLNPHHVTRKRLFDADLRLRSQCQELDQIFRRNHWILPKYSVILSTDDGKFQSIVTTKGLDFEYTLRGDPKDSPAEARESAAACMLTKLQEMAVQACHD